MARAGKPPEARRKGGGDRANVVALVFVVVLVAFCIWLFNKLNSANQTLNCEMSGRTNCAEIPIDR